MESFVFWNITPCDLVMLADVSEEHISSILRVEGLAKKEVSRKRTPNRANFIKIKVTLLLPVSP
jgi:hypothetical protein